ncbi:acyltransferase family protein [Kushneria konosiri]|nr:acyltransferase [Kushneria konosiri]
MGRVHSIDYLRGIMALSVLIYHYLSWTLGVPDSSTVIGRLGVYAVSTFYVISGISLYIVYRQEAWTPANLLRFAVKRYFRIAPLFILAASLTVLMASILHGVFNPDWPAYFANASLTFGFYDPRGYIPGGGWSIGNEIVFYVMFPALIFFTRNTVTFALSMLTLFGIYLYFAFYVLTPEASLAAQWLTYINPLNQAFLFGMGVAIGKLATNMRHASKKGMAVLLAIAVGAFAFFPASGNQINIVSGFNRILFTAFCGLVCFSLTMMRMGGDNIVERVLNFFGDISYSLYLLHIVVAKFFRSFILPEFPDLGPHGKLAVLVLVAAPFTVLISFLVYTYIEKPVIRMAKRITKSRKTYRAEKAA